MSIQLKELGGYEKGVNLSVEGEGEEAELVWTKSNILIETIPCGDRVTSIEEPTNNIGMFPIPRGVRFIAFVGHLEFPTTGTFTVDVKKNGESILSTPITFADSKRSSLASEVQSVISDETAGAQAEIKFDVIDEGGGDAAGLKIQVIYQIDLTIPDEAPEESSEPAAVLFVGESSASPNTDGNYTLTGTYNGKPFWNKSGGSATTSSISWNSTANQWEMYFAWGALAWVRPVGEESPIGVWGTYDFPVSGPEVTEV